MDGATISSETMFVAGLDEAGRGAVLGPLVVATAWFDKQGLLALRGISVQDSKAFGSSVRGRRARGLLAEQIKTIAAGWGILLAEAEAVDTAVAGEGLNHLERRLARALLERAPQDCRIVADGERIFGPLKNFWPALDAYNRADSKNPAVSAASILAKNERDQRIESILAPYQAEFGPITGMGYPNKGTAEFLRRYHASKGDLPPHVRRSWKWRVIEELSGNQGRLPL